MIKYKTKSEYYKVTDGLEISKRIALRDYDIKKYTRTVKKDDQSKARGYEYIEITITYINVCAVKTQLEMFNGRKQEHGHNQELR